MVNGWTEILHESYRPVISVINSPSLLLTSCWELYTTTFWRPSKFSEPFESQNEDPLYETAATCLLNKISDIKNHIAEYHLENKPLRQLGLC